MKKFGKLIAGLTVTALLLAGCGAVGDEEAKAALDTVEDTQEEDETSSIEEAVDAEATLTEQNGDKMSSEEDAGDADEKASTDTEEKKPVTMAGLVGDTRKEQQGEELPETILWFNATYAPLTYSNGWNWRLIGGLEPSDYNRELTKDLLEDSWSVTDRESALETTKSLLQDGHRKKCLDYTKQMEEWGILDLGEEEFVQQLLMKELDGEPGRYAVAYLFHQSGIEPEYMAAWDLCRVNQLYADYYFCGYMSYEEAMDASLANSLNLQELYGSWEEMAEAYLLGYRFWQGDVMDGSGYDSPTQERRNYYEALQKIEDGPYTLDWNMELTKSW